MRLAHGVSRGSPITDAPSSPGRGDSESIAPSEAAVLIRLRSPRLTPWAILISGKLDVENLDIDVGLITEALEEAMA